MSAEFEATDIVIPRRRANLYGDFRLSNGNGQLLSEMTFKIPKKALSSSGVLEDKAPDGRIIKYHEFCDDVPASAHEIENKFY